MFRIAFALAVLALILVPRSAYTQSAASSHPSVLDVTSIDTSVDPCTDFFTYSCGGWLQKNPIPPDKTSWGIGGKLADDNRALLREILEEAAAGGAGRDPVKQKIGDYYTACMDEKAIETAGASPLKSDLERISKMHSKRDMARVIAAMPGLNVPFAFQSDQDYKNSSQVIAEVDQSGLGLPDRDYYLNTDAKSVELRQAYVAHVQKMFELLGDAPEVAPPREAQTVLRIETALAKGSLTQVERRDPKLLYHKMTRRELEGLSPSFRWKEYFSLAGQPGLQSLNVTAPEFFKAMDATLKKESLDSWKAYLRWHLVNANAPYLSTAFVDADFDFFGKTLTGAQQLEPRWKRCVNYVDNDLGEALGQAYVERAFPPEAKQRAQKLVKQIEDAMQQDIDGTLLDVSGNEAAGAGKVACPGQQDRLSRQMARLQRSDHRARRLHGQRQCAPASFEFNRQIAKIGKPVDRGEWDMTPPTVNAYYNPQINDINFPAGILQPPFFDPTPTMLPTTATPAPPLDTN